MLNGDWRTHFVYLCPQSTLNKYNKRAHFTEYEFLLGNYLDIYGGCAVKHRKQIKFKITEM